MAEHSVPTLSIVIPVFNEGPNLSWLSSDLMDYLERHRWDYELIYVNDGSTDDSEAKIREVMAQNPKARVRYLAFSRNFGKEAATTAGIFASRGKAVIMYDADGQFPMALI